MLLMIPHRQRSRMNLLEVVSCLNANPQLPVPWLISGDDPHSEVFIADHTGIRKELIKTAETTSQQQKNNKTPESLIVKQVNNNNIQDSGKRHW